MVPRFNIRLMRCMHLFMLYVMLYSQYSSSWMINLTSYKDANLFYGSVKFNNVPYKVIFDTGSTFVWVGNKTESEQSKMQSRMFSKNKNFLKKIKDSTVEIKYGTGSAITYMKKGILTLFQDESLIFDNFKYGESIYEESKVFENVNL